MEYSKHKKGKGYMIREELCPNKEMQNLETEFWCHAMVEAGHTAYTDRFHDLTRLVPHLVTPKNKRIERNGEEPRRDGNVRDNNKRSRTGRAFASTTNPVRREYTGSAPKLCLRLNRAPRQGGNRQIQAMAIKGGQGRGNNDNHARRGAFMMEARQDLNIMTGMFTLNNHYATTLFNCGADYSFVSTTFIPLLDMEPSNLGFSYAIEIASGQLVEINKAIRGRKLDIGGHTFDIDLISFGHISFNVIVGMDWLSRHNAEIVFHEKLVRILLPHDEMLRVLGEWPEEKEKHLMRVKAEGQKLKDIVVVRNFFKLFPNDLSGLPPSQEIKFHIDLIPRAMLVVKSPYRLAPSEIEELSTQLRELQDKGFIRPSSSPWGAPSKTYDWGEEHEMAFQTLKDKLCNETVLALPNGPENFVVYYDALCQGLGPSGLLQQPEILEWKWKRIAMDFVTKFPRTSSGHDSIWVTMDRLTKSAHFLPMREDYKMDRLARLYLNEIVTRHGVQISILSDRDGRFMARFWQSMKEDLRTQLDMSTAYHPQTDGQSERTIQALKDMLTACFLYFERSWDVHIPLVEF
nr:putative reverse transcriptase domain-containing protein [Tanacetum cinerariifolium]